jgi:hypothetical protein
LLPHIQAARQVTRIESLRVRRKLDRGDFDGAIRDVETVLRLARDVQPRGAVINQLVVTAINHVVYIDDRRSKPCPLTRMTANPCD